MIQKHTRRKAMGLIGAGFTAAAFCQERGANNRVRLGLIGCGMRGKYLLANLPPDAKVMSLCDCSLTQIDTVRKPTGVFKKSLASFAENDAGKCSIYQDYRVMLDEEKLDGVIIATPDHHHALPAMLACARNMDVYVEKPLSLTVSEGRAMVAMAQKHNRVVQVGSQQRTMAANQFACEFVREGGLGKVSLVQVRNYPGPVRYESLPKSRSGVAVPKDLNWDLFCGPTRVRPYDRDLWVKDAYKYGYLTWRGWDLFRSFSGHLTTNWGGHSLDMVQYALGMDDSGPTKIKLHTDQIDKFIDDMWHEKTPPLGTIDDDRIDKLRFAPLSMWYANGTEVRFDPSVKQIMFHGTRGKLFVSRNRYRSEPADLVPPPDAKEQAVWEGDGNVARPHLENWLDCIRTRATPNAPIEVGHRSATVCHLANIAREITSPMTWDPKAERFNSAAANSLLTRERRKGFELPT